jgi:hypothetical protein
MAAPTRRPSQAVYGGWHFRAAPGRTPHLYRDLRHWLHRRLLPRVSNNVDCPTEFCDVPRGIFEGIIVGSPTPQSTDYTKKFDFKFSMMNFGNCADEECAGNLWSCFPDGP